MSAFDLCCDRTIDVYVSAVSAMEISTKYRIGKLAKAARYAARIEEVVAKEGFIPLPLTARMAISLAAFDHLTTTLGQAAGGSGKAGEPDARQQ